MGGDGDSDDEEGESDLAAGAAVRFRKERGARGDARFELDADHPEIREELRGQLSGSSVGGEKGAELGSG